MPRPILVSWTTFLFLRFYLLIQREEKGGRKRGRETSTCGCLSCGPHWGPGPQLRHVPWLGIEQATLWFTAHAQSTELHQPGLLFFFFFCNYSKHVESRDCLQAILSSPWLPSQLPAICFCLPILHSTWSHNGHSRPPNCQIQWPHLACCILKPASTEQLAPLSWDEALYFPAATSYIAGLAFSLTKHILHFNLPEGFWNWDRNAGPFPTLLACSAPLPHPIF